MLLLKNTHIFMYTDIILASVQLVTTDIQKNHNVRLDKHLKPWESKNNSNALRAYSGLSYDGGRWCMHINQIFADW